MPKPDIEKTILLDAPLERVWAAISDSAQFGTWFGAKIDGPFVAGQAAAGVIAPTSVDPDVAGLQAPHAGKPWHVVVDRIEPPYLFSIRWHPFAIDPAQDYSGEPMTLVTFLLAEDGVGTRLTITETGFADIPAFRRDAALKANDGGWTHQAQLVRKYLAMTA